jgi:hypothetical protein
MNRAMYTEYVTDQAQNPSPKPTAESNRQPASAGNGRAVPRYIPPTPPIPTRFYVGKGASGKTPPASEKAGS